MSIYYEDDGIEDSNDPYLEEQRLFRDDAFFAFYLNAEEHSNIEDMAMDAPKSLQSEKSWAIAHTQDMIDMYDARDEMMNEAWDVNLDY